MSEVRIYDEYVTDAWLRADYDITSKADYAFFGQTSSGDSKPVASINLSEENTRVVQTVSNTRVSDVNNSNVEDPSIVGGVPASVGFSLETDGVGDLPDEAEVTVTVSKSGPEASLNIFTLTKSQISNIAGETHPITVLADVFQDQNPPPVFTPEIGTSSIEIEIDDAQSDNYIIKGDSVTLQAGDDFDVVEVPRLTVGIVGVQAPMIESDSNSGTKRAYGDNETGKIVYDKQDYNSAEDALDTFADNLREYLQKEYPSTDVKTRVVSGWIKGSKKDDQGEAATDLDYRDAYREIYDRYPESDVALAVVPNLDSDTDDYYFYHGEAGTKGQEPTNGKAPLQPQEAAAVLWQQGSPDETVETAAHELAHHFLPYKTYSPPYSQDDSQEHLVPDEGESEGVVSTGLTIQPNTYDARDGVYSFMSYANFITNDVITDALTHQKLIDSGYEPHPPEATIENAGEELVEGFVSTSGEIIKKGVNITQGLPLPSAENNNIIATVIDGNGDEIYTQSLAKIETIPLGESRVKEVAQFVMPLEDTATKVKIETENGETSFNPLSGAFSEKVAKLPDAAFKRNPEERRNALFNKSEAVAEQIEQRAYQAAKQKMERDIRNKVKKWLKDDYDSAANQPDKADIFNLIDNISNRLNELAQNSSGNKPNKSKGRNQNSE
jgi:hypothetical protein